MSIVKESLGDVVKRLTKRKMHKFYLFKNVLCETHQVVEIEGSAMSGGAELLTHIMVTHLIRNVTARVVYLDCERSLSPMALTRAISRMLMDIGEDREDTVTVQHVVERLFICKCTSVKELFQALSSIEVINQEHQQGFDLIAFDNISAFHWLIPYKTLTKKLAVNLNSFKQGSAVVILRNTPTKTYCEASLAYNSTLTHALRLHTHHSPRVIMDPRTSRIVDMFNITDDGVIYPSQDCSDSNDKRSSPV